MRISSSVFQKDSLREKLIFRQLMAGLTPVPALCSFYNGQNPRRNGGMKSTVAWNDERKKEEREVQYSHSSDSTVWHRVHRAVVQERLNPPLPFLLPLPWGKSAPTTHFFALMTIFLMCMKHSLFIPLQLVFVVQESLIGTSTAINS